MFRSPAPSDRVKRKDFRLSRRSLVAAGALIATVGSTRVAEAMARPFPWHPGFGPHSPKHGKKHPKDHEGPTNQHCFLMGTRLLTPAGEVAIEKLAIGDLLVTHDGVERPIRWIGRRMVRPDRDGHWPEHSVPVRIARGALATECPHRDLYVSRTHLLYLNGVLVHAGDLLNGTTLAAVAPEADVLHYFHVELDNHDVVLAEGAPCDSLLPAEEHRRSFDNYDEYVTLYGTAAAKTAAPFAPIAAFNGARGELRSRMRSALAPIVDFRHPLDVVRDEVEARGLPERAA